MYGDLNRFRICMRTLFEFSIKYSVDDQMQIKCEFKEMAQHTNFVIQFSIILKKNEKYDLEPLEIILGDSMDESMFTENGEPALPIKPDLSFEKEIKENYQKFLDYIKEFGYGMIIFPSVVNQLHGDYFIFTDSNSVMNGQT